MADKRSLLFSIPRSAFRLEFFRAGGKGGQKQNKTSSACRITHVESGAIGESREERYQHTNRRRAFRRLADSKAFRTWLRLKVAAVLRGYRDLEEKVERLLRPENLRIERLLIYTCDGCKRQERRGEETGLPEGWLYEPPDRHLCTSCRRGRA